MQHCLPLPACSLALTSRAHCAPPQIVYEDGDQRWHSLEAEVRLGNVEWLDRPDVSPPADAPPPAKRPRSAKPAPAPAPERKQRRVEARAPAPTAAPKPAPKAAPKPAPKPAPKAVDKSWEETCPEFGDGWTRRSRQRAGTSGLDHTYVSPAGRAFPSRVKVVQHLGLAGDPGSKGGRRLTEEEREERIGAKQLKEKEKGVEKSVEMRAVTGGAKEAVSPVAPPTAPLSPGGGGGGRGEDEPVAAAAVAALLVPGGGSGRAHSASLRALLESVMPAEPPAAADENDADDDADAGEEEEAAMAERAHTALCGTLAGSLRQLGFAPAHPVLELLWHRAAPRTAAAATAHEVGALAALRGACSAPVGEGSEEGDAAVALRQLLRRFPPANSAAATATAVAVDVADAARAGGSRQLLRCVNHALAASGASAALTLAADSALLRAAADALSSPRGGSGAAELLDVLHDAVTGWGAPGAAPPPPPK
jgi:hypothetical protein